MDIEILLWFQKIREALGFPFSIFIAVLSDVICYGAVVYAVLIYWCRNKKLGISLISIYGISVLINQFLKATFTVYRPWIKNSSITPSNYAIRGATGYSFPSSHAQSSAAINGTLAINKRKKNSFAINIFIIFFMAFTRLFIGVHTPTDVVVGMIIGILSIFIYYYYLRTIRNNPKREKQALLLFFMITAICVLYALYKSYPETYIDNKLIVDSITMKKDSMRSIGVFIAIFLGFFLEKKYVDFKTEVSHNAKTLRFVLGLLITAVIFGISRFVFPLFLSIEFSRFFESFILGIVLTFIYPYFFNKYENTWLAKLSAAKNKEVSIFPHE